MKFDNIIGNPPYKNMIDLKFLTKSFELYKNHILFVHPSTWLLDEKFRQPAFNKARELVHDNLKSIHLFNGNTVFGISLFLPCVITHIDSSHSVEKNGIISIDETISKEIKYNNIYEINKFSDNDIYPKLKKKILNWIKNNKSLQDILDEKIKGNNYVNISQIRGNVNTSYINIAQIRGHVNLSGSNMIKDDFYTFVPRDLTAELQIKNLRQITQFGFADKLHAENFLSYLKTDFARFCLSIYKINQNLYRGELRSVPYLDYSKIWTDNELYKLFNITDKEIEFIKSKICKYYEI